MTSRTVLNLSHGVNTGTMIEIKGIPSTTHYNVLFQKISIPLPWKVFQIQPPTPPEIPF